jgi:hypothetical protein
MLSFEPGTTIEEIVETLQPKAFLRSYCRVWVGGEPIQPKYWPAVRPKPGSRVEVIASIPQGGGNAKVLRFVAFIAVAALAIAFPYAAPATWGLATAAGLTTLGSLVGAGIGICGPLRVLRLEDMR